jgi:hypothetical protein
MVQRADGRPDSEQTGRVATAVPFRVLSVDEAATRLTTPAADLDIGVLRDLPLLVVEDAHLLPPEAAASLARLPVVSIGLAAPGTAPAFDVLAVDAVDAAGIASGIVGTPGAALACCQVLRHGEGLDTSAGLLLESTAYGTLQAGTEFAEWLEGRGRRVRPAEAEPPVLVEADGDTVTLTLNRPRLRNAFSAAMRDALVEALRPLAAPGDSRQVLLAGNGSAFCCGGDPAEFGTIANPVGAHLIRSSANAAPWLDRLAGRLTVRVHGPAVGAGVELAAFAGRLEATDSATFCLPEVSMGLMPGAGGTVSVPRRIGRQRTARMCLTGTTIDAATALGWGLVDAIVD